MRVNRILCSHCVLFLLLLCLKFINGQYQASPHIIVFMVDDLGWNDVGFHGSNQIPTPNIDALAYNGIILNRHYVQPSCTPTRAAFFSGKYPLRMGMQGQGIMGGETRGLPLGVRLLPEYLRDYGYSTRLVGKWHLGFHTRLHTPLNRGFDSFFGYYNSYISYYDYRYSQGNMSGFDLHRGDSPAHGTPNQYVTELLTNEALKIIDNHDVNHPLYLQLNHLGVHAPLEKSSRTSNYNDDKFEHIADKSRKTYAEMVVEIDESLGQIVSSLGDRGMLKNSIILFMTDNGAPTIGKFRNWGSNWPLRGTKYTLYEGGLRGVAAIWSPRLQRPAKVSNNLMHVTDWLPTLFSAAGGNVQELGDIDGIDHWQHLSNDEKAPRHKILLNIDEVSKTEAAINKRYKLVRGVYQQGYYDSYYGDSGKDFYIGEYNYTLVHRSSVATAISAHLGDPMTQPSVMTHLREEATVLCNNLLHRSSRSRSPCENDTECLFDIVNDPCEERNVAKQYPKEMRELDLMLLSYGNLLVHQPKKTIIDWSADPKRRNDTWEPWLHPSYFEDQYGYNKAEAITVSMFIYYVVFVISHFYALI